MPLLGYLLVLASWANAGVTPRPYLKEYLEICQKDKSSAFESLDEDLSKNPSNLDAYAMRYWVIPEEGKEESESVLTKFKDGENPKNDFERIVLVAALAQERRYDEAKIRELLNFKSKEKTLESYRLYLLAGIESDVAERKKQYETLLKTSAYVDPYVVYQIVQDDTLGVSASDISKYIAQIPLNDPMRSLIEAEIEFAKGEQEKGFDHLKLAYEQCPVDSYIADRYGHLLFELGRYHDAEKVLHKLTNEELWYPLWVDLDLTAIYLHKGHFEKAKMQLERIKPYADLLPDDSRRSFERINNKLDSEIMNDPDPTSNYSIKTSVFWVAFLTALVVTLFFGLRRRRQQNSSSSAE